VTVSIADALAAGSAQLQSIADNPRLEARLLLAHALGLSTNDLIRDRSRSIDPAEYYCLLNRRLRHEPIAYITGHREFWSLDFLVSPATLIPRPDSETLIEAAFAAFTTRPPRSILDLGTGTGCLLLSLLHGFPNATGIGTDLSPRAAALARANAARLGLGARASFAAMDWACALSASFDLVISNPPYIRTADVDALMPDVADYEPQRALDGGIDGFTAYRSIIGELHTNLAVGGVAILELGAGQSEFVARLAEDNGFIPSIRLDLAGIPRGIVLTRRNG
jgi:release factor glutamine methyltransferase